MGQLEIWLSSMEEEVDIMAYVLTNGNYYIRITENGGVAKTKDVNEAQIYLTMEKSKRKIRESPK